MDTDNDTLGPCGCTDYHMSDCPTRGGSVAPADDDWTTGQDLDDLLDYLLPQWGE